MAICTKLNKLLIVLAGVALGQVFLYGPSLVGQKVLLPLDILKQPGIYLPIEPGVAETLPRNPGLGDLIYCEPVRRLWAGEFAAGRVPLWLSNQYCGMSIALPRFRVFSFEYWFQTPVVVAWAQFLSAIIAGLGMFAFCRRVLGVRFWVAAVMSWIYPFTGFFVLWLTYGTAKPICWLPWLLFALSSCLRGGSLLAAGGIAVVSCFVLTSGNPDMGGQVLLVGVLFGIWCLVDLQRAGLLRARLRNAALAVLAVVAGIMMASDYLLPYLEHGWSGARVVKRSHGTEERPPMGATELPQVVLPDIYGTMQTGSYRTVPNNQQESSATAYCGFLSVLVLAPLAFCGKKHRSLAWFLAFLTLFALSWSLNLWGFVQFLRLPGLNLMSHNRLVFAASLALLGLAALGLEALLSRQVTWQKWFRLPVILTAALGLWCLFRLVVPPSEISSLQPLRVAETGKDCWLRSLSDVQTVQAAFRTTYLAGLALASLGLGGWWLIRYRNNHIALCLPVVGTLLVADMLWFVHGRTVQCSPDLYYPPIPALRQIADAPWGRVIGSGCLPAPLATAAGLCDVRGFDGVDPARFINLLLLAADAGSLKFPYAATQWLTPRTSLVGDSDIRLSPVLNLLSVRYVIFRGSPPAGFHPKFQSPDYWVVENTSALPRAFVPESVERITDSNDRLQKLGSPDFDPRKVAYIETDLDLPPRCRGSAEVTQTIPTEIKVQANMETAGLLLMNDRWDPNWRAYVNGEVKPIEIADHALRGVLLPAGPSIVEFRYESASRALGVWLGNCAAAAVVLWVVGVLLWQRGKNLKQAQAARRGIC